MTEIIQDQWWRERCERAVPMFVLADRLETFPDPVKFEQI